jgi:preprotein translocase subunit SecA
MASLAAHAHPVIQRVYEDDSNQFVNIAVPFTDGRRNMQVLANIQDAVDSSGTSLVDELEKSVVLGVLDQLWKEHLRNMDDLRSNVQHARFEQKDPLLIYKFESYELFKHMVQKMNQDVASFLLKCQLPSQPDQVRRAPGARPAQQPRVQTSKQGVQNLNEQRQAAARSQAAQGAGTPGMPPPPPPKAEPVRVEKKVLPNEPCPCGSGKKYKKCHGL